VAIEGRKHGGKVDKIMEKGVGTVRYSTCKLSAGVSECCLSLGNGA
jgi:hypothetical protein